MLLDAMTGKPEWCGALTADDLHQPWGGQEKKKEKKKGGLKHRNERKERKVRRAERTRLLELRASLQPRIQGLRLPQESQAASLQKARRHVFTAAPGHISNRRGSEGEGKGETERESS